jgi:phytoene dehydrogenase-like protein
MADQFDAVVIGAGHNGLAAAAVLAGKGKRVLVVERSASVGGMAAKGLLDGVVVPRLAHLVYNLNPTVAREIGLGLNLNPVPTVALSADGRHVVIEDGRARFADGSAHPDADAFQMLHRRLVRFGGLLGQLALAPPPLLSGGDRGGDMARLAKLGLKLRLMGKTEMREFLRIVLSNARDLILDELPDGPLAGALAADAVRGDFLGPASPGTVFTLIYRLAQGGGAALPADGMAEVSAAFRKAAEARGVTVRTGAGVRRIVMTDDRASGVVLDDGTEIASPLVLSSAGAKATLEMAGVAHFDIEAARRLKNFRTRGTAAKVNLLLDTAPDFTGLDATLARGRLLIAPSVAAVERAFNPVKYGEVSKAPVIEAVVPTLTRPDASGKHVVSAVVQYVPHTPGKGWTAAKKAALLKTVIAALDGFAPGLKGAVIASEVLTPADIEAETGAPGGHWHHGEMAFDQLLTVRPANGMARYGMGPKGLFLAGASAHPGGDITGAPGRNAALAALKAEGRS